MQQRREFHVDGLDCAEEIALLTKALERLPGLADLGFDLLQSRLSVTFDDALSGAESIERAIAATGLRASPWNPKKKTLPAQAESWWTHSARAVMAAVSGGLLLIAFLWHWRLAGNFAAALAGTNVPRTAIAGYLGAVLCGAWFVAPRAATALRLGRPDMHLLMCVAAAGAMALGDWFEAATVSFLFAVALLLEQSSLRRTRRAIAALLDLAPPVANCRTDSGTIVERPVAEVEVGTTILVRPGEKVPLDGEVLAGRSHLNEAPITGEARPAARQPGDAVYAGTINGEGALEIRTTRPAADTTLARIVHLVEQAQSGRSVRQQWVDRFALRYTPAMMVFAAAIALVPPLVLGAPWSDWFYRGLVVLVIACPCALVISTPVSLVSALTAAARHGILVKGGAALEAAAGLRAIAFDKTGTLTSGRPEISAIVPLNGHTPREVLERAAALEVHSRHPLAQAIVRRAASEEVVVPAAEEFRHLDGRGAVGTIDGREFWIGSQRLMQERQVAPVEIAEEAARLEAGGHSVVVLGNANHVCGLFGVADSVRPDALGALAALKQAGVTRTILLTGDNRSSATLVARELGLDEVHAELLPEDKLNAITRLVEQCGEVAMVGDGVNDAPALARATLGIAMGAAGSDAAIETADVALMSDDLDRLPWLIRHARQTVWIIRQNIAFSLGVKLLFLILTLAGLASLWLAIAADTGATLLVIANSLRLLKPGGS
jgi:Cd2+/Zn2+-exporting ATPase